VNTSKMPSFTTISALLLAIIGTTSADIFTATASLPGSNLDGLPVNAAGRFFWLGGSPASYCPTVVPHCPVVTQTVIADDFGGLAVSKLHSPVRLKVDTLFRLMFLAARKSTSTPTVPWDSLKLTLKSFQMMHILAVSST